MKKDAQDERIAAILGEIEDLDFDETIDTFHEYLKTNLSLPCEVIGIEDFRWEEIYVFGPGNKKEYEQLKKTQPSYTDRYELFEIVRNAESPWAICYEERRLSVRNIDFWGLTHTGNKGFFCLSLLD